MLGVDSVPTRCAVRSGPFEAEASVRGKVPSWLSGRLIRTAPAIFAEGRWQSESLTLRLESGLPFSAELDAKTARLVRGLDGSRTLGEALAAAVDDDERDTGLALARQMLAVGFLDFASQG